MIEAIQVLFNEERSRILEYVISDHEMAADPRKIDAIKEFPVPANLKQLKSFLRLAS